MFYRGDAFQTSPSQGSEYNVWGMGKSMGCTLLTFPSSYLHPDQKNTLSTFTVSIMSPLPSSYIHLLMYPGASLSPVGSYPSCTLESQVEEERRKWGSLLSARTSSPNILFETSGSISFLIPQVILPKRTDGNQVDSEANWLISG